MFLSIILFKLRRELGTFLRFEPNWNFFLKLSHLYEIRHSVRIFYDFIKKKSCKVKIQAFLDFAYIPELWLELFFAYLHKLFAQCVQWWNHLVKIFCENLFSEKNHMIIQSYNYIPKTKIWQSTILAIRYKSM